MATIGRKLAAWVYGLTYDHLGDKTVHEARRRVLDSIGTALGAYYSAPGKITREIAAEMSCASSASIWPTA